MIETVAELVRYGSKGALTTTLNIGFMAALVEWVAFEPAIAAVVSTCTLLTLGYAIMNRWVFPDADGPDGAEGHARRAASYYAVILTGKGVNYALFLALLAAGVWYPAAWLIGSVTVFFGTFSANRWVWRRGVGA